MRTIVTSKRMRKIQRSAFGLRRGKKTRITLVFDVVTPKDYPIDPAVDEIYLIDMLDQVRRHSMEFHDVPGFRLVDYAADGERVL